MLIREKKGKNILGIDSTENILKVIMAISQTFTKFVCERSILFMYCVIQIIYSKYMNRL